MERLLDLFHRQPDDFLAAALLLALALGLLGLWLEGRRARRLRQRLDALEAAQQERLEQLQTTLADHLHREFQTLLAGQQRAQTLLGERIDTVEKALLREQGQLRLDLVERFERQHKALREDTSEARLAQQRHLNELGERVEQALNGHRETFEKLQREAITQQQKTLIENFESMNRQLRDAFRSSSEELGKRVQSLTQTTDERLREISGQVEKRLADGFEKTTETFTKVLEHLSRIDEAQKKITELSGNVVSLQEVLTDKRSRGAFGEVQLEALVRNMLPEDSYSFQATLSNGKRVDCLLRLPDPTGKVPIDAKFPLESYQRMQDFDAPAEARSAAATQFRRDIQKHIRDIAGKYLIPGETADGAVMFIPAEAIFAEIHAHFPELVEEAQRARVWLVSPTTLMAVLTTARAVLKDDATRKQIHIIQEHLHMLSKDFGRFQERMDKLARHIALAHKDVEQVHTSARKISSRFQKIERVEIAPEETIELLEGPDTPDDQTPPS